MNAANPVIAAQQPRDVTFASGTHQLAGTFFHPSGSPRAAVVLHGATGVPQTFYAGFAQWLAGQGLACLTYDYRDFGASAQGHPRRSDATMADWGVADQSAAQGHVRNLCPDAPLWVIGHSLGGLMVPFQPDAGQVARVITVASGAIHLSDHPWPYRAAAAAFWYGPGPLATAALGYLPGRRLGMGEDLPAGVYWQWRRWCTSRGFVMPDIGHSLPKPDWRALRAPTKFVAVEDDQMVPPAAVWRLMQYYPQAIKTQLTLKPGDYGLKDIGHLGAFRRRNAILWPAIIA